MVFSFRAVSRSSQISFSLSLAFPSALRPAPHYPFSEAKRYFLKAIEIAQKQQAKSFELRATMSLVRLWQQQGKRHEAHNKHVIEIYHWFTEGFDTKDLQEAKVLLESLSSPEHSVTS